MERERNKCVTDRQTESDRQTNKQSDSQTESDRQTNKQTNWQTDRQTESDRQTDRQTESDRQTGRQADGQTDGKNLTRGPGESVRFMLSDGLFTHDIPIEKEKKKER